MRKTRLSPIRSGPRTWRHQAVPRRIIEESRPLGRNLCGCIVEGTHSVVLCRLCHLLALSLFLQLETYLSCALYVATLLNCSAGTNRDEYDEQELEKYSFPSCSQKLKRRLSVGLVQHAIWLSPAHPCSNQDRHPRMRIMPQFALAPISCMIPRRHPFKETLTKSS